MKAEGDEGVACAWRWTSELHAPRVFPLLGRLLLRAALRDFPIRLSDVPTVPACGGRPEVAFIVGHRGRDRLPHLAETLRSIAGQAGVTLECIVVEQDQHQLAREHLPSWVHYIHTPPPREGMPYCRAWALNVGARKARSPLLVLHDGDLLVPEAYSAELVRKHRQGYTVINLKRFVFYVSERHTADLFARRASLATHPPERIVQNAEAGGSVAVDRDVFLSLGGMDEGFVGWGGEDNEFWDRALTRRVWQFGYLPVVHLWHPPQPGKRAIAGRGAATAELSQRRASIPVAKRIEELLDRKFGDCHGLDPGSTSWPYRIHSAHVQGIGGTETVTVHGLVSTIIPVFNRRALMREAVESVLAQTYRPIEVIVVDDGSTDDTAAGCDAFARDHPGAVRIIHQANTGPGLAREAGRRVARGEYIQYLDSDDLLLPGKFELQVAGLRGDPRCGVAYGKTRYTAAGDSPWKRTGERIETMFPAFVRSRWWDTSTPLYRRDVVDKAGPWTALWQEEDWEYDCRIASQGIRLYYCDSFVSEQRAIDPSRLSGRALGAARKLRDRAAAHRLIFTHAQRAGIGPDVPEMQHFARELFLLARQCGAADLPAEAQSLFSLARVASGERRRSGWDFRCYGGLAAVVGWTWAGRIACFSDRLRAEKRSSTRAGLM